jgi:hypothetical protein
MNSECELNFDELDGVVGGMMNMPNIKPISTTGGGGSSGGSSWLGDLGAVLGAGVIVAGLVVTLA